MSRTATPSRLGRHRLSGRMQPLPAPRLFLSALGTYSPQEACRSAQVIPIWGVSVRLVRETLERTWFCCQEQSPSLHPDPPQVRRRCCRPSAAFERRPRAPPPVPSNFPPGHPPEEVCSRFPPKELFREEQGVQEVQLPCCTWRAHFQGKSFED